MLYFPKQTILYMFCIIGEIQVLLDGLTSNPNKSFLWLNKEEEEPAAGTSVFLFLMKICHFSTKKLGKVWKVYFIS
jgi:hypothetical protein